MSSTRTVIWLTAVVLTHLAISLVHGFAHTQARVPMSLAVTAFVYAVILAGPLVGLALVPLARRTGCWVIAAAMGGALVFGLVNHFGVAGPDHVNHVAPQWRMLFAVTAMLLAVTEGVGAALAVRAGTERSRS